MKVLTLQFTAPYRVSLVETSAQQPGPHQLSLRTIVSAISSGTELLVYRGEWPPNLPMDETIASLRRPFSYPLPYGYAAVAIVEAVGQGLPDELLSRRVFAFHPHQSRFLATPDQVIFLPDSLATEAAAFLPNMETAIGLVMDGKPIIGERVLIIGQGVVGLLTTALLSRMPLERLITVDNFSLRRQKSRDLGADASFDPTEASALTRFGEQVPETENWQGADLVYEVSGNPAALTFAIEATGFSGRVVVGSWYGTKRAPLDLGGRFHRGRIRIISSQVSRLGPEFTGLWTKTRRLQFVLRMLEACSPGELITHRFHISEGAEAYRLLHEAPDQTIQVVFTYEE